MTPEIIAAVIALVGSCIGSFTAVIINSKLIDHRLKVLEKKVDKHNHLVERMAAVETAVEDIKDDLRR